MMSKRKEEVSRTIALITEVWGQYPNLRLCQLLGNCFSAEDLYYIKDSEVRSRLKETYGADGACH